MPGYSALTVNTYEERNVFKGFVPKMAMACFLCSFLLVIFFFDTNISASEIYTNVWAVKIRGNQREVEELARKYGFRYDSHVSTASPSGKNKESRYCQKLINFRITVQMPVNAIE